jgi:hypothetical protein
MALGIIIGPTGNPYTLQANPVGFNYLMYSRALQQSATSPGFSLGLGPVAFSYTPTVQGYNPPLTLSLSPVAFAYAPQANSFSYSTGAGVKFNPGHYMAQAGNSVSSDISDLTSYGTGIIGYCLQLSWAQVDVGTTGPSYNFSVIDSTYTSLKAIGKHLIVSFKTSTYVGNVCNPIGGANPYNTSNAASGQVPQWLINNGPTLSVTDSLTGTVYSTTAFPASPNPSQYGWFVWDFNGNSGLTAGFEFIMGAHQYHPVAAAAYTNMYRALLNHVMPSGLTFNNDPYCEMIQDIDELTFSMGYGSSYLPAIVTDTTYKINGVLASYNDINGVAQTAGKVSYTNAQCYRFIADSKTRVVASAPNTSIGCCDGFGIYGTDGQNTSTTHTNFMQTVNAGRVILMGSDTFNNSFGLSPNTTGPYSAATAWKDSIDANGHASYWLKLYVGCVFNPMSGNPFTGTQVNPASYGTPASGGECFFNTYPGLVANNVENLDYNQNPSSGVSAYTAAMVNGIWNSAQYYKPPWSFWANTDNRFQSPDAWRSYIYAAIQGFGAYPFTTSPYGSPPSAPRNVTAYAGPGVVYVRFQPPASSGSSSITSYKATASTGENVTQGTVLIATTGGSYQQLNCRVDINGMAAGTPVTVTVQAINSAGTSIASAASGTVTPTAVANPYVFVPGNENPACGDFSYGSGAVYYGTIPGQASRVGSFSAPTNPVLSSNNVVEVDGNEGFQPYFLHVNPTSTQGGRFKLYPYPYLELYIYPTSLATNGYQIQFLKALWIDGVMTSAISGGVLTDTTQSWPTSGNVLNGSDVLDITSGNIVSYGVTGNTATTLTGVTAGSGNAGDYYEVEVPDISIGQAVTIGNGSVPAGVTGPATMTANAWNFYKIPITLFNGGGGNYPTVAGVDILKFGIQAATAPSASYVAYFANVQFTTS